MPKNKQSVECELDPGNIPPLSESQKTELEVLEESSDEEINYSDIQSLGDNFWKDARPLRKPRKIIEDVNHTALKDGACRECNTLRCY